MRQGKESKAEGTAHADPACDPAPVSSLEPVSGFPDNPEPNTSASRHSRAIGPLRDPIDDPLRDLVLPRWRLSGAVMLGVAALLCVLSRSWPDVATAGGVAAAAALSAAAPRLSAVERRHAAGAWQRFIAVLAGIWLPMFLWGAAMAQWAASRAGFDGSLAIAASAVLMLTAMVLLEGRMVPLLAALVGVWLGLDCVIGNLATHALSLLGTLVTAFAASRAIAAAERNADARIAREHERRRAEELLTEYEQTGQGWFWETDRRGLINYVSPRIARIVGRQQSELEGRPFTELFLLDRREQESERTLIFHLSTRSSFQDIQVRAAARNGEERWWSVTGRPILDRFGNFLGFRGSGSDLTEARKSQRHVAELARQDALTKLANRYQMTEWLQDILGAPRMENRACAVMLLDLDRFKQVNDTMGHPVGDALLQQVADRLRSTVRSSGCVGRLGGDEFQVIVPGHTPHDELAHIARRIIENLSQPYCVDGDTISIGVSVGLAVCPDDGLSSEELIRNADLALYAAKDGGRGRYHFYAGDLHSEAQERRQLEQDLREAMTKGSLELYYQPQVRVTTERITGVEALLRWNHPRFGYISPAKFIPIAEDAGLIATIGEWALRTACHEVARWPVPVRVAVNVSPLQFSSPALPAVVASALAAAGMAPDCLELEITESVFLGDDASTEAMFGALKRIGVRLALDDFGTGYSSLGYLRSAPFDKIKIDQSFVRGATVDGSRNGAIIAAIVSLAEALGMETTAEGVETLDELDLIRNLGCSHVQGFIYEKPLPSAQALQRLEAGLGAVAKGPRSSRAPRQTMLRKVTLEHQGHRYAGTIRNVSQTGAMIDGLWNVPKGSEFAIHLADDHVVPAVVRWSNEDRMGIEFARPLALDATGAVSFAPPASKREKGEGVRLRKAG